MASASPTSFASLSNSPNITISASVSLSPSPSLTPSESESPTNSASTTPSSTFTPSSSNSETPTPSSSNTETPTPSSSNTETPTPSSSCTETPTPSSSSSKTLTPSSSNSGTPTNSNSASASITASESISNNPSPSLSSSQSQNILSSSSSITNSLGTTASNSLTISSSGSLPHSSLSITETITPTTKTAKPTATPTTSPSSKSSSQKGLKLNNNQIKVKQFILKSDRCEDKLGFDQVGLKFDSDPLYDFASGAPGGEKDGEPNVGYVVLVYGQENLIPGSIQQANITDASLNRLIIWGNEKNAKFGYSLTSGDFTGDGIDDLAVGAPYATATPSGQTKRPKAGVVTLYLGTEKAVNSTESLQKIEIIGAHSNGHAGLALGVVKNLTGNGKDALLIGAPHAGEGGEFFIVFGGENLPAKIDLAHLSANQGIRFTTQIPHAELGSSLDGVGDPDDDGTPNVLAGSPGSKRAYLINIKKTFPPFFDVDELTAKDGSILQGEGDFGRVVSKGGDFNDDDIDDILISAPKASPEEDEENLEESGIVYCLKGSSSFPSQLNMTDLTSNDGVILQGGEAYALAGSALDVRYIDGRTEIIVGKPNANPEGICEAGEVDIVFGTKSFFGCQNSNNNLPFVLRLNKLSTSQGIIINGNEKGQHLGRSVAVVRPISGTDPNSATVLIGDDVNCSGNCSKHHSVNHNNASTKHTNAPANHNNAASHPYPPSWSDPGTHLSLIPVMAKITANAVNGLFKLASAAKSTFWDKKVVEKPQMTAQQSKQFTKLVKDCKDLMPQLKSEWARYCLEDLQVDLEKAQSTQFASTDDLAEWSTQLENILAECEWPEQENEAYQISAGKTSHPTKRSEYKIGFFKPGIALPLQGQYNLNQKTSSKMIG